MFQKQIKLLNRVKLQYLLLLLVISLIVQCIYSLKFAVAYISEFSILDMVPRFSLLRSIIPFDLSVITDGALSIIMLAIGYFIFRIRNKGAFLAVVISMLLLSSMVDAFNLLLALFTMTFEMLVFISFVFCVLWILIFSAILQKINTQVTYDNAQMEATKFHRLINVLIDTSLLLTFGLVFSDSEEYPSVLILIVIYITYYTFFEYQFGYTLGKLVTGTRVVQANGEKLTLKQTLLRTLIRYIPVEPFTYLMNTSGWHDKWVGTKVLKVEKTLNKWYHYVLSIVVGMAMFILFIALQQFLDKPYTDWVYQKMRKETLEAELTKISTCFSQLDTSMVMTFDLSVDSNSVHASFSVDSVTSNSVRLCAGLIEFTPKVPVYSSLDEQVNDDAYNIVGDIEASYDVNIELLKSDFEDCPRLEEKLLQIFKVNDKGVNQLKIKQVCVESYVF